MNTQMAMLRELREKTGAGIMDCKRALERSAGDGEKAAALLKELGLVQEKKRAGREALEGRVFLRVDAMKSVIVKIACETDFVSRSGEFVRLGEACLEAAFAADGADPIAELAGPISAAAMKFREHIALESAKTITAGQRGILRGYLHGEGRIGAVVRLEAGERGVFSRPEIQALLGDLSLHAAAFAPLFLSRSVVDPAFLRMKEEEFTEDVRKLEKKESMRAVIVRGKLDKLQRRICFLEQPFIRDEARTVAEVIVDSSRTMGQTVALTGFLYEAVGPSPA